MSDLPELLFSGEKHLRAERKSKATVKAYGDGIRSYIKGSEHAGVSGGSGLGRRPRIPGRRVKADWRYPCACCQPKAHFGPRRGVRYNGHLTHVEVVSR